MSNFLLARYDATNAASTHAVSDISVLTMARKRPEGDAITALNDGHMIHRNTVPAPHACRRNDRRDCTNINVLHVVTMPANPHAPIIAVMSLTVLAPLAALYDTSADLTCRQ